MSQLIQKRDVRILAVLGAYLTWRRPLSFLTPARLKLANQLRSVYNELNNGMKISDLDVRLEQSFEALLTMSVLECRAYLDRLTRLRERAYYSEQGYEVIDFLRSDCDFTFLSLWLMHVPKRPFIMKF